MTSLISWQCLGIVEVVNVFSEQFLAEQARIGFRTIAFLLLLGLFAPILALQTLTAVTNIVGLARCTTARKDNSSHCQFKGCKRLSSPTYGRSQKEYVPAIEGTFKAGTMHLALAIDASPSLVAHTTAAHCRAMGATTKL